MFINQDQVNKALNSHFINGDGEFLQEEFDFVLRHFLNSNPELYDLLDDPAEPACDVAFQAFRGFTLGLCEFYFYRDSNGEILGLTTDMLLNWLRKLDPENPGRFLRNTNAYINEQIIKKKEVTTMKSTIIDPNIIFEDIHCEHCGCLVATPEAGKIESFELIDGAVYCQDCIDQLFVTCYECGERILRADAEFIDGEYYCFHCCENLFEYCEDCEEWHDNDHMTYVPSVDRYVCDDCLEAYYSVCPHCDEIVPNDNLYTVFVDERMNSERWCAHCSRYETWECSSCGRTYADFVPHELDDYDDPICYSCHSPNNALNPYSFKPYPEFKATAEEISSAGPDWEHSIIFYGFELEIDRREKCYEEAKWAQKVIDYLPFVYCKKDCSLSLGGDYSGFENVSHPGTFDFFKKHKADFEACFKMLIDGGWLSHNAGTCGLHVHISLHPMEAQNPFAVHNMLILFDRFWEKLVNFSRRTESQLNHWARRYSTAHENYAMIKDMAKQERNRYMAVNLQNSHTVEIRIFRGTLNVETFFATLGLVDVITKKCIEIGNDPVRIQSITWEELVESDYEELNAYLVMRGLLHPEEDAEPVEEEPEAAPVQEPESTPDDRPFLVGDLVYVINDPEIIRHEIPVVNCSGIIRHITSTGFAVVEFFDPVTLIDHGVRLHNCTGLLSDNVGCFVPISGMAHA